MISPDLISAQPESLDTSFTTRLFWLFNVFTSLVSVLGLAYNLETVIILLEEKVWAIPIVYLVMVSFFAFNMLFLIKGLHLGQERIYRIFTKVFLVISWIFIGAFTGILAFLLYFGLFVETNHDVYLLFLMYVVSFMGPVFLLSLGYIGLHHSRATDHLQFLMTPLPQYIPIEIASAPQFISGTTKIMTHNLLI